MFTIKLLSVFILTILILIESSLVNAGPFGKELTEDVPSNVLIFSEEFGDLNTNCTKTPKGKTRKRPPCETKPYCNGIVVDTHWVITAAHCIGYVRSSLKKSR